MNLPFPPQYGVLLTCIFILELSAAIAAFALHSQVPEMLQRTMSQSLEYYNTKDYVRDSVDMMQEFVSLLRFLIHPTPLIELRSFSSSAAV